MVRPCLTVNGRRADTSLLKNCKASISVTDYIDNRTVSRDYDDLTFDEQQELVLSFQIPPNLSNINITLSAQCQNVTTKKLESFSSQQSFKIKEHSNDCQITEMYLRRIKNLYYVYVLGRNGEPQKGTATVIFKHCDYRETHSQQMKLNGQGMICIGSLHDIEWVKCNYESLSE